MFFYSNQFNMQRMQAAVNTNYHKPDMLQAWEAMKSLGE